jgi:hypothetical protein
MSKHVDSWAASGTGAIISMAASPLVDFAERALLGIMTGVVTWLITAAVRALIDRARAPKPPSPPA